MWIGTDGLIDVAYQQSRIICVLDRAYLGEDIRGTVLFLCVKAAFIRAIFYNHRK
jgi:hypothetical protein